MTWQGLAGGTVITSTPFTATLRAGTVADLFDPAILATQNAVIGTSRLHVRPGPPVSLEISPNAPALFAGAQQQFTAIGTDSAGNRQAIVATWSANPAVGSIDNTGKLTASSNIGAYANGVTATAAALTASTGVSISGLPPASITIAPASIASPGIALGQTQLFTATVKDINGELLPGPVTWSSTIGAIASTGPLTALLNVGARAGVGDIAAAQASLNAQASVLVAPVNTAQAVATPSLLVTNGRAASTVVFSARTTAGPVGAGLPVTATYSSQTAGLTCVLTPANGVTTLDGTFTSSLKCTHTGLTKLTSLIRVNFALGTQPGANASVDVQGEFTPPRQILSAVMFFPLVEDNHFACKAYPMVVGGSALQRANNATNIYKFTATTNTAAIELQNYRGTAGFVSIYRLVSSTNCPVSAEIAPLSGTAIPANNTSYSYRVTNLVAGTQYLFAVQTTGALSSEIYTVRITP